MVIVAGTEVCLTQKCAVACQHVYKSKRTAQSNIKKCAKQDCDGHNGAYPTCSAASERKLKSLL